MKRKFRGSRYFFVLFLVLVVSTTGWTHHGWGWATDEEFEITGVIVDISLGNPHGEVVLNVGGKMWTVEVGQPYRNDSAGLTEGMITEGRRITIHGHRSAKMDELLIKAERVIIDGRSYNLYPDRVS